MKKKPSTGKKKLLTSESSTSNSIFSSSHQLITLAAFRYALGRKSYIVAEITKWITDNWNEIPDSTLRTILTEVESALEMGQCGDENDVIEWEKLQAFARTKFQIV